MKVKPISPVRHIPKDKPREFCGTVEGIDLTDPACIVHINDIHHAVGRTHRSVNEAFRGAEYAIAIERHQSDWAQAVKWFTELFSFFFWAGACMAMPVLLVLWLFR